MGIQAVRKRDGRVVRFNMTKIADAIFKAAHAVGGEDRHLSAELADVVILFLQKRHPDGESGVPDIEEIQDMVEKVLIETGHARTAKAYILYREKRTQARRRAQVRKSVERRDSTDIHLMVDGKAVERIYSWDRQRIAQALVREADLNDELADEISSVVEKRVLDSGMDRISTSLVRELVDNELFNRGLTRKLERQASIGMPMWDLEQLIFSKSNENSNISVNNPEAINLAIAEHTLKQYALAKVFSQDVSDAHRRGMIHVHDLGYPTRVYCSSHSLEYLKKYGLRLGNLETSSGPAKYARTLTGHLNTFLASMQAYYAGALGVAHINIMYAPLVEDLSDRQMLQEAQHLIFSSSQNAFSRGGQTLFLDFNIHTGIPIHLRPVRAIGPGGRYVPVPGDKDEYVWRFVARKLRPFVAGAPEEDVRAIRERVFPALAGLPKMPPEKDTGNVNDLEEELAGLEERARSDQAVPEKTVAERQKKIDGLRERVRRARVYLAKLGEVMDVIERESALFTKLPEEADIREIGGECNYVGADDPLDGAPGDVRWVRTYGTYEEIAARFTRAMLTVWREGDQHRHLFRFPKCDFHVDASTFKYPDQEALLDLACDIASENGTPYFIFDRDAVVLSACCRLRTRIEDTHMLDHPESLRFCGFQNVTVNLPQCSFRAGRGNFNGLKAEIEKMMDLAMKAHIQKKEFVKQLMSQPSMPLWEIGKVAADGRPYVDLEKATYIIGLIGLNECVHHLTGHELHESNQALMTGLKLVAHMYYKARELGAQHKLKVTLEESPAESAARRLAKVDFGRFPQAKDYMRGDAKTGEIYYTNSIHLRADAPVDLVTRIRVQSKFHSLIESGAIVHAFVGERRPSPAAIKSLVRLAWEKTQAAQITISPEFTLCGSCDRMIPGLKSDCPHCGRRDVDGRYLGEVEIGPGDRAFEAYERLLARSSVK